MSEPERLDEVGRWLGYAEEDLRAARALMGQEDLSRQVCFHAQQAAEKAIKSIFVFLQTEFPYTHDLDRLRGLLPYGWLAEEEVADLSELAFWATRGRYPSGPREATEDDARTAVRQASEVFETVSKDLEDHGYGQRDESNEPEEENG